MIPLACLHGIVPKLARSDLTPPQWNAPVIFGRVTARSLLHYKAGLLNRTGESNPRLLTLFQRLSNRWC
jgi:hypothetical protein